MFKNKKSTDFASQVESLSANKATSLTSPSVKDTNAGAKAPEAFSAAPAGELSGYVMKFNAKDGYGFVKGEDGVDYFFRIENFDGKGELPAPGRYVKFTVSNKARQMGKAPKIAAMRFDEAKTGETENQAEEDDTRTRCPYCGKMMVPKVVFYHGSPEESICPFCLRTIHVVHYPPLFSKKNIFVFLVFLALAWIFCFGGLQFIIDKSHYYDSTQHFIDFLNTDVAEESKNNPVFEKEFSSNPDFWKLIKTDSNYCSKLNVSFVMCLKLKYFSNN